MACGVLRASVVGIRGLRLQLLQCAHEGCGSVLRFSTFAVLVTVVGTFSLKKLIDIVNMIIGDKDKHVMDGYGAQTPEIFIS